MSVNVLLPGILYFLLDDIQDLTLSSCCSIEIA